MPYIYQDQPEMELTILTRAMSLQVNTDDGINPHRLCARASGWTISQPNYAYGFGRPRQVSHSTSVSEDGTATVAFSGRCGGGLQVTHRFAYRADNDWLDEWLELSNLGPDPIDFAEANTPNAPAMWAGFVQQEGGPAAPTDTACAWLPVPLLCATDTGEKRSLRPSQIAEQPGGQCASEGWVLTHGDESLLVIKYNPDALEHSVLRAQDDEGGASRVVFGGTGVHQGDPEAARRLEPGATLRLGMTRYQYIAGGWQEAFYTFRSFMDARGHRFPPDFDPPVHWNVIYDNPQWWHPPDNEATRARHYRRAQLVDEAVKAKAIGCEALYLDPGWDTHFGSTLWDTERLGPADEFVRQMREEFDLSVSLHTPLANWNIDKSYPESAWLRDEAGDTVKLSTWEGFDHGLCSAAPGWWITKRDRLLQLAADGFQFLMFDGTNYTPCYDPTHGHGVPLTREQHIRGYAELARAVRQSYPDVRIEMHDQVYGPVEQRYVPFYYTHGPDTFETIWGFEYMWYSMQDLLCGKAVALYYYNLAYNLPLYLHVNLKTDNHHALMFWWFASTCRHLGFGGRDPVASTTDLPEIGVGAGYTADTGQWEAHCAAMRQYRRLKPFFSRGAFFGIDESTHVHTLPGQDAAVLCCFNLTEEEVCRTVRLVPGHMGLRDVCDLPVSGAESCHRSGEVLELTVRMSSHGVSIIEIGDVDLQGLETDD